MAAVRTANPALSERAFARAGSTSPPLAVADRMTVEGTVNKTILLLLLAIGAAAVTLWVVDDPADLLPLLIPAVLIGFVVAIATVLKPAWARITAPLYAVVEGVVIAGLAGTLEQAYPGIATQAAFATFATAAVMFVLYRTRVIRVTAKFRSGVIAATGAIALMYLGSIVLGLFGVGVPFLHDSGPIGIGVSVAIIGVAALNLLLDFDFIEQGAQRGAAKVTEWYAAFGLLVTLIWLYIEFLRLLAKLQSRD